MSRAVHESTYAIAKHYRRVVVWTFDPVTRRRIGEFTRRPDPSQSRHARYLLVITFLREHGITTVPPYEPSLREIRAHADRCLYREVVIASRER